jgi:hypothetical protein
MVRAQIICLAVVLAAACVYPGATASLFVQVLRWQHKLLPGTYYFMQQASGARLEIRDSGQKPITQVAATRLSARNHRVGPHGCIRRNRQRTGICPRYDAESMASVRAWRARHAVVLPNHTGVRYSHSIVAGLWSSRNRRKPRQAKQPAGEDVQEILGHADGLSRHHPPSQRVGEPLVRRPEAGIRITGNRHTVGQNRSPGTIAAPGHRPVEAVNRRRSANSSGRTSRRYPLCRPSKPIRLMPRLISSVACCWSSASGEGIGQAELEISSGCPLPHRNRQQPTLGGPEARRSAQRQWTASPGPGKDAARAVRAQILPTSRTSSVRDERFDDPLLFSRRRIPGTRLWWS